jgi:vitamin B12 transporter
MSGATHKILITQLINLVIGVFVLTTILLLSDKSVADEPISLPDVVITSNPAKSLFQAPSATYLDQQELQRSGQRELTQVLRGTAGLSLFQGMKGGPSGVSLRGASGSMGLVTIDGIPLHDTLPGGLSLDLFPAETFGSSDIKRGSSAMLDFGRSLGGVINLHSRNNSEPGVRFHLEGGSFGALRESAIADLGNQNHRLNLSVGRDDLFEGTHWADSQQGNTERDNYHAYQLAGHLRDQLSEDFHLDSSVYYINSENGVDKTELIRLTPEFSIVDDPGRANQEIWLTQSTATIAIHPQWQSQLQLGYTEHRVNASVGGILPGAPPFPIGFTNQLSLVRWKNSHSFWLNTQQQRGIQLHWGG